MQYLWALLAFFVGAFFIERSRLKSANGILDNQGTKEKANEVDKEISKQEGTLASEAQKREEINKEAKEETDGTQNLEELEKFFNRDPHSK